LHPSLGRSAFDCGQDRRKRAVRWGAPHRLVRRGHARLAVRPRLPPAVPQVVGDGVHRTPRPAQLHRMPAHWSDWHPV